MIDALYVVRDVLTAVCLLAGSFLALVAAIGIARFDNLFGRMHAATKPQVLGLLCMLLAVVIHSREWTLLPLALLGWALMLLTAPVSAHMVGRSSYRTKHVLDETLIADDLAAALDEADTAESQGGADRPS